MEEGRALSLIFNYRRPSTYGLNVLLGAVEEAFAASELEVLAATDVPSLVAAARAALEHSRRVLVAWSFCSPQFVECAVEVGLVKREVPDPRVIHLAGGAHATAEPEATLLAGFDLVGRGDGEKTLVDLVRCLLRGGGHSAVRGLGYRCTDHLTLNAAGERVELGDWPPFAARHGRFNPIEITRGCVWTCAFCQTPFLFRPPFRHRPVEQVCRYVRLMRDRELTDVRFITPTSLSYGSSDRSVRLDRVEELLASVREAAGPRGRVFFGTFPSEVRPEHVTPETLRVLKKYVSNRSLTIGGQSGSQRLLDAIRRGHTVEQVVAAARLALEAGFVPQVSLIFGLPGETGPDVQASLRLAQGLSDLGARIRAHTFMPLPGTPLRKAPPGRVSATTMRRLDQLAASGRLDGQWRGQIPIARRLAALGGRGDEDDGEKKAFPVA